MIEINDAYKNNTISMACIDVVCFSRWETSNLFWCFNASVKCILKHWVATYEFAHYSVCIAFIKFHVAAIQCNTYQNSCAYAYSFLECNVDALNGNLYFQCVQM